MRLNVEAQQALKSALKLCEWIAETTHQSGSINGLAAQVEHAARAALAEEAMQRLTDEQQEIEAVTDCHDLNQARAAVVANLLAHFGINSANSDVNLAYLHKQLDDFLAASIGCSKGVGKLNLPLKVEECGYPNCLSTNGCEMQCPASPRSKDGHIPDATKMIEPVAYVNDEGWFRSSEDADAAFRATARPLYAAPPKREPLTIETINKLWNDAVGWGDASSNEVEFVRSIERAHGIGGGGMSRDDIINMARETGMISDSHAASMTSFLERFAALVAAAERERRDWELAECYRCGWDSGVLAEREACAKACESLFDPDDDTCNEAETCAAAIRARKGK